MNIVVIVSNVLWNNLKMFNDISQQINIRFPITILFIETYLYCALYLIFDYLI